MASPPGRHGAGHSPTGVPMSEIQVATSRHGANHTPISAPSPASSTQRHGSDHVPQSTYWPSASPSAGGRYDPTNAGPSRNLPPSAPTYDPGSPNWSQAPSPLPGPPPRPAYGQTQYSSSSMAYQQQFQSAQGGTPSRSNTLKTAAGEEIIEMPRPTNDSLKPQSPRGWHNATAPRSHFRWDSPHHFQEASWRYVATQIFRHVDCMGRKFEGAEDDRYISPTDGRIKKLLVQTTDEIYDNPGTTTYRRTYVRNVTGKMLRLALWPTNHFDFARGEYIDGQGGTAWMITKWVPACIGLTVMLLFPGSGPQARNGGLFDSFPYKYHGYAKVARNAFEAPSYSDLQSSGQHVSKLANVNPVMNRLLRPRWLCFLNNPEDHSKNYGVELRKVDEMEGFKDEETPLRYLFVAYTAQQFNHESKQDMLALDNIAETAARAAGLPAYWIGSCCLGRDVPMEDDVFRISDVIRGAAATAIALGPPNGKADVSTADMLQQWGERLWTFPEVLLSQPHRPIMVYVRNQLESPLPMDKIQFAAEAWHDSPVARQLIDHYEGTLGLSRLELTTIALQCLQSRKTASQYLPGDHSYALMGLLRVRPTVDRTDTAFQAFARLSLANDSDQLLERLICILPKSSEQEWYSKDDAWNVSLWDIYPTCQIAGVCDDNSVIIDGNRGAAIRWKSFAGVANLRRKTWKRAIAQFFIHTSGLFFYLGIAFVAIPYPASQAVGAIFLIWSIIVVAMSPYLLRVFYSGKLWATQPWFFGFEGYMDIATIERQIFGTTAGRLTWSAFGSPLSRHHRNEHGECVSDDPVATDPAVAELVQNAKYAKPGEQRIFTLIDTAHMEVILFQSIRPPVGILLCGSEGGMQRAVGVSYDWTSGTCFRETVFRLPTTAINSMSRVSRVKFGLKRKPPQAIFVGDQA